MKVKEIMLVALVLLAILTIGAVSASDDNIIPDNLTVSSEMDESIDLSVENGDIIAVEESEVVSDDGDIVDDEGSQEVFEPEIYVPSTITYPDYENISVVMAKDAKGNIVISSDEEVFYNSTLIEGQANVSTAVLPLGHHYIVLSYDGDDYDIGDLSYNMEIIPKINYPFKIWTGEDNYVSIEMPKGNNGNLTLKEEWEDYSISGPVVDGYGILKLDSTLNSNVYGITYEGNDGYSYSTSWWMEVSDENPNFEMNAKVPSEVLIGSNFEFNIRLPDNAYGLLDVIVDGELFESPSVSGGKSYIRVESSDLEAGEHELALRYHDHYYRCDDVNYTFSIVPVTFEIPENIVMSSKNWDSKYIYVRTVDDIDGYVTVVINDETVYNDSASYDSIRLPELPFGQPSYEAKFWGSEKYPDIVKTGTFNVTYKFELEVDQYYDYNILNVRLPYDASGNVNVTVNGKTYSADFEMYSDVAVEIDDLKVGEHEVEVVYSGDEWYPGNTFHQTININPRFYYAETDLKYNESFYAYLKTYENASGVFSATNDYGEEYCSVPVANGHANVSVSNLGLGTFYINLRYDENGDGEYYGDNDMRIYPRITFNPILTLPKRNIWAEGENYISIEMPESYTGNLTFSEYWDDDNVYASAAVVNGFASIRISNFTAGFYDTRVKYADDSYSYSYNYEFNVKDESPDFELDATVPTEVFLGEDIYAYINFPNGIDGKLAMVVDGEVVNSHDYIYYWDHQFTVRTSNLTVGEHELVIMYYGGSYYNDVNKTFTIDVEPLVVTVPDTVILGGDYDETEMRIMASDILNGSLCVYIDGKLKYNKTFGTFDELTIDLDYLSCGEHNYAVVCSENDELSENGTFNVTYRFYVNHYGPHYYGEDVEIYVHTYSELEGDLIIQAAGKTYVKQAGYSTTVTLSDLAYGENIVNITYVGDDVYPARTITAAVDVGAKIFVTYSVKYNDTLATLALPDDAKGNLVATIGDADYSAPLINGKATLILPEVDLGYIYVNARYDSDDYDVEGYDSSIRVIPNIKFPDFMWKDGEFNVTIVMPKSYNGTLDVSMGGDNYNASVENGVGCVIISNPTSFGYRTIYATYTDDKYTFDDDAYIYIYGESSDYNISGEFESIYLLGSKWAYWNSISLPYPQTGVIEAYVDGKAVELARRDISDEEWYEIYRWAFDIESMTLGKHAVELRYHGDQYYQNSSTEFTLEIVPIDINVPDEFVLGDYEYIEASMPDNITGNLTIYVDGKEFKKLPVSKEILYDSRDYEEYGEYDEYDDYYYQGVIYMDGLTCGEHTYKMLLSGEGFDDYTIEGKFNVTYRLGADIYANYWDEDIYYGDEVTIDAYIYHAATNNLTVIVDGKAYNVGNDEYDGYILRLSDVGFGDHNVTIAYDGDDLLNAKSVNTIFTVGARINVPYTLEYGKDSISILLPADAEGNLSVTISGNTISVPLVDGKANIPLLEHDLGEYRVRASYTGADYPISSRTVYVDIVPYVHIPTLGTVGEYELNITMPEKYNGTLEIQLGDKKYSAQVINGKGKIMLSNLKCGDYCLDLEFNGTGYEFSESYDVYVRGFEDDFVLSAFIPRDVIIDENVTYEIGLPSDVTGKVSMYLDGELCKVIDLEKDKLYGNLPLSKLTMGEHTIALDYTGDEYYPSLSSNETFNVGMITGIPDVIYISDYSEDSVLLRFHKNLTGYAAVLIDGVEIQKDMIINNAISLNVNRITEGVHTYEIRYSGDKNNEPMTKSDSFAAIASQMYINSPDEIVAGQSAEITVYLPSDATGTVTLNINNKSYMSIVENAMAEFTVSGLPVGSYQFSASYSGNSKYEAYTKVHEENLTVGYGISVSDGGYGGDIVISILLPSNATGQLVVYLDYGSPKYVSLVDGKANYTISNCSWGYYDIGADYTGSDYDVVSVWRDIDIRRPDMEIDMPRVIEIGSGEKATVELPDDIKGNLTVVLVDYRSSYKVYNVFANLTNVSGKQVISLSGINRIGKAYVRFTFTAYDNNADDSVIYRSVLLTPKINVPSQVEFGSDEVISVELPSDADGIVDVYITDYEDFDKNYNASFVNGKAVIPLADLPIGYYWVAISCNNKYGNYYEDYDEYYDESYRHSLEVTKVNANARIDNSTDKLTLLFPDDATGEVFFSVDGKDYFVEIVDSKVVIENVESVDNITVTYSGDAKYDSFKKVVTTTGTVDEVTPVNPGLIVRASDIIEGETAIVNVEINKNITVVNVNVNNKDYVVSISDGKGSLSVSGLSAGEYVVIATFAGNKYFLFAEQTAKITVTKKQTPENHTAENATVAPEITVPSMDNVSGNGVVPIDLPADATGKVTLTVDGVDYVFDVVDGKADVKVPELANGDYPYTIKYSGDAKYSEFSTSGNMKVNNADVSGNGTSGNATSGNQTSGNGTSGNATGNATVEPEITVPSMDNVSANGVVPIDLPADATGKVTLTVDGVDYVFDVVDGKADVKVPELANGDYPYTIKYSGDAKYSEFSTSGSMKVNNADVSGNGTSGNGTSGNATSGNQTSGNGTSGNATSGNQTSGNGTSGNGTSSDNVGGDVTPEIKIPSMDNISADGVVTVDLPSDATGNVTLTVDGKDYVFDVKDGKADVKVPELANGDYPYTIKYSGDTKYSSFTDSGNMKVNNADVSGNGTGNVAVNPVIEIPSSFDDSTGSNVIPFTLPSDATGKVTLTVDGKDYVFDVKDGKADVKLPELANGNHQYTISYSGDSKYASYNSSGSMNVNKPVPVDPKIVASNAAVLYSAGSYYSMTVYGTDGKVAKNTNVVIKVAGRTFKTLTTDSNGVAKFKVSDPPATYKMTITALGKSLQRTLTVKHLVTLKTVKVKKSAKKLVLQATLGKINGKYLKNKKITFKFKGKKYTAKTNKKGVAKVTIKSSVLKKLKVGKKVTYQATYLKDTVKKTVKVKK